MRKHETAVCRTARTVVWEVGKREVGGKHFYQRLPPTRFFGVMKRILENARGWERIERGCHRCYKGHIVSRVSIVSIVPLLIVFLGELRNS